MSAEVLFMLLVQMVGDGLLWVPEFLRLIILTEGCYWARINEYSFYTDLFLSATFWGTAVILPTLQIKWGYRVVN